MLTHKDLVYFIIGLFAEMRVDPCSHIIIGVLLASVGHTARNFSGSPSFSRVIFGT